MNRRPDLPHGRIELLPPEATSLPPSRLWLSSQQGRRKVSGATKERYHRGHGCFASSGPAFHGRTHTVITGRKDRKQWVDHEAYLSSLGPYLSSISPVENLVLAGDFNQRLPRLRAPVNVHQRLEQAISGLMVATKGLLSDDGKHVIDHVVHSRHLQASGAKAWLPQGGNSKPLSDHSAVTLRLNRIS